jgi:hypothetical protein
MNDILTVLLVIAMGIPIILAPIFIGIALAKAFPSLGKERQNAKIPYRKTKIL